MHAVTKPVYVALALPGKWHARGAYALRHEINVFCVSSCFFSFSVVPNTL